MKAYISHTGLKSLTLVMAFLVAGAVISKAKPIFGGVIIGVGFWECVCYTIPKLFDEFIKRRDAEFTLFCQNRDKELKDRYEKDETN